MYSVALLQQENRPEYVAVCICISMMRFAIKLHACMQPIYRSCSECINPACRH